MLIRGATAHKKWVNGCELSRREAIEAMCYECNGGEGGDCCGYLCPLYEIGPFKARRRANGEVTRVRVTL